jgi:hypothetical protein
MLGRLKVVYAARNAPEAHFLRNLLAESGIKAVVTNDVLEGGAGVDIVGWPTLPRVVVAEENADAARQLALEFERSRGGASGLAPEDAKPPEPSRVPPWWPRCPGCGAPRLAQCPCCGTAGTEFLSADPVEWEPEEPPGRLVICPTCDEAMPPAYLRECEWCGHRFADGVAPPQAAFRTEWSWRVVIAVIALAAVVVGLIAYFAWLV